MMSPSAPLAIALAVAALSVTPVRTVDEQLALILSGAVRPAPVRVPVATRAANGHRQR
jgi:hypothetical protein